MTTTSEAAYEAYQEARRQREPLLLQGSPPRLTPRPWSSTRPSPWRCWASRARPRTTTSAIALAQARGPREGPADRAGAPARRHGAGRSSEKRRDDGLWIAREIHAEVSGRRALGADPRRRRALKGNSDQAIKIFEELLAVDPNNAEAYNQIGYYYGYRGDYDKAIENLQALPVHRRRQRQPLRLARRDPGLLGPLQRGDREPEPRARDQARLRRVRRAPRRRPTRAWATTEGDRVLREGREMTDSDDMRREYLIRAMRVGLLRRRREGASSGSRRRRRSRSRLESKYARARRGLHRRRRRCSFEGRPEAERVSRSSRHLAPSARGSSAKEDAARRTASPTSRPVEHADGPGARGAGQDRRGPRVLEEEREPAQRPSTNFERAALRSTRRAPSVAALARPPGRSRRGREADRREPQVERRAGRPRRHAETAVAELRREKVLAASK